MTSAAKLAVVLSLAVHASDAVSNIQARLEAVLPDSLFGFDTGLIFIAGGALLLLVSFLIIIVGVISNEKKTSRLAGYDGTYYEAPPQHHIPTPKHGMHDTTNPKHINTLPPPAGFRAAGLVVKISNLSSNETWSLQVQNEILIGRAKHCDLILDDISVAREQCKITANGSQLALSNLSGTNITFLNGDRVSSAVPLRQGDTFVLGRSVLRVDHILSNGLPQQLQEQIIPLSSMDPTELIID